jgi:small subunit ribosomal protein S16
LIKRRNPGISKVPFFVDGFGPGFPGKKQGSNGIFYYPSGSLRALAAVSRRNIRMSATIRLKKFGSKKRPYYRIVVMDKRAPRDGKTIEELGYYHPIEVEDKQIMLAEDKVKTWLSKGVMVSDTVRKILNRKNITL